MATISASPTRALADTSARTADAYATACHLVWYVRNECLAARNRTAFLLACNLLRIVHAMGADYALTLAQLEYVGARVRRIASRLTTAQEHAA